MERVSFFTPVSFGDHAKSVSQSLLEWVDDYFYFGGRKACVISGHTKEGCEGTVLYQPAVPFQVTALKVATYATVIIPILMLIAKIVLRSLHSFYLINVRKKVEKGIHISPNLIAKIQDLMPKILAREKDPDINWLSSGNNLVFTIASDPNLVFKLAPPSRCIGRGERVIYSKEIADESFENTVRAKEVCLVKGLESLLLIPHTKKIEIEASGQKLTLVAQERFKFNQGQGMQEEFYQKLTGLEEAENAVGILIAETGWSDVVPRNIPIVDDQEVCWGSRRIVAIDLEEMESAATGFFGGDNGSCGLIGCLSSERQIDTILAIARRYTIIPLGSSLEKVKAERMKEIELEQRLRAFYENKGIAKNARALIHIDDLSLLGFNLEEQAVLRKPSFEGQGAEKVLRIQLELVTMREAITNVVQYINNALQNASEESSTQAKRYVHIDTNDGILQNYFCLPLPEMALSKVGKGWVRRIIDALVEKGYLFRFVKECGYSYFVQA